MKNLWKLMLILGVAVLCTSTIALADTPGDHPAYLHALTDLRHARAHIDIVTPNGRVNDDETRAVRAIDAAINDIKQAAIDDGKPLSEHPPVDAGWDRTDRFHRALELLNRAHADIDKREDNGWARGLKHRALGHIDEARRAIHHALHDAGY